MGKRSKFTKEFTRVDGDSFKAEYVSRREREKSRRDARRTARMAKIEERSL